MKTKEMKRISGTYEKCKEKEPLAFQPLTEPPPTPDELEGEALRYWIETTSLLTEAGTLTKGDLPAILRASQMFAVHQQAVRDVQEFGAIQRTGTYTAKSGYWQVMTDSEKFLSNFERYFGLTPYGRSKLPPVEKPKEPNEFDELLKS
jgi:P27 family predicted phage terminase small subunit